MITGLHGRMVTKGFISMGGGDLSYVHAGQEMKLSWD